jgi:DNA-binding response OmpR family regulator
MCTCTQVCSALRAAGARLPIIAMTGNVDPGSVELFKRVGFSGLLAKPFNEVRTRAAVAAERRRHDALKRAGIWRVWMCCAQADACSITCGQGGATGGPARTWVR